MNRLGKWVTIAGFALTAVACGGSTEEASSTGEARQALENCNCPTVIDPVCGEDGKTYDNACVAECAGVKVAYEGECKPSVGN